MSTTTDTERGSAPLSLKAKAALHVATRSNWIISLVAVVIAFIVGAFFIWIADASILDTYWRLFKGAIFNPDRDTWQQQIKPLTETFKNAAPLILGGLGLGLGFRAGLFNIGGQGQMILGAIAATYLGFTLNLPYFAHLLVALIGAAIVGGLWGGIAGFLKAKTGANEVIVTIMLNSIAGFLLLYVLGKEVFLGAGNNQPKSQPVASEARLPELLPSPFDLHAGIILAIIATVFVWWLLERSKFGFELRAVGANAHASETAGMSTSKVITLTMMISAGLCGLAGANQILGTFGSLTQGAMGSIGFDAITVALLGRNRPIGIFGAGLLFGAFSAGSPLMQGAGVPVDMILILQSVIVLLIAAPPLIRWMFRFPKPDGVGYREYITLHQEAK
ncbi:ABC transporter permease [Flaviflexus equikiangi]|uniref:ABC transporter permease n=1 Tax=Flaviflexus equikiangi TaxID=2758573 RepID=A0ABS2TE74_9ACTO|nr:ABC transporter permease [Flaviflexus equikiangi]MBM9432946.1 ABC transporter permease [Flaviflexus equikiangi]